MKRPLDEEVRDFWGMSLAELDEKHIQKPVGQLDVSITRWRRLPTPAFRRLKPKYGEAVRDSETVRVQCFIHPDHPVYLSDQRYCPHEPGGTYAVDPDEPFEIRVEKFMALWRSPEPA